MSSGQRIGRGLITLQKIPSPSNFAPLGKFGLSDKLKTGAPDGRDTWIRFSYDFSYHGVVQDLRFKMFRQRNTLAMS